MDKPEDRFGSVYAGMSVCILLSIVLFGFSVYVFLSGGKGITVQGIRIGMIVASGVLILCLFWLVSVVRSALKSRVQRKESGPAISVAAPPKAHPVEKQDASAVMLLSLLQEKGRFLDFAMEDITTYSDEQVGAAARIVHQGAGEVIMDCFSPEPICTSREQDRITLDKGFSSAEFRLVGKVTGEPPFTGVLKHKGWRAKRVALPKSNDPESMGDKPVLFAAEVEM